MRPIKLRAAMFETVANSAVIRSVRQTFEDALQTLWTAYQPIVWASKGDVFGYEALLRTEEPDLPNPGVMLEVAESLEQLDVLGRTVRQRAAQPMHSRNDDAALFVNLHTSDLLDPSLFDADAPLSQIASRVVLEITERSSLSGVEDVVARVTRLRELGFRIAIDDLGAGYSGLSSFAMLEPEIVKLDMTLVRDAHQSKTRQKLIASMTSLCHDMGMLVVAEGVETIEERDALRGLGCDLLQGYLLARPDRPFPKVNWQ